jgi:hypothetical protein
MGATRYGEDKTPMRVSSSVDAGSAVGATWDEAEIKTSGPIVFGYVARGSNGTMRTNTFNGPEGSADINHLGVRLEIRLDKGSVRVNIEAPHARVHHTIAVPTSVPVKSPRRGDR